MCVRRAALTTTAAVAALLLAVPAVLAGDMFDQYGDLYGASNIWDNGDWEYTSDDSTVELRGSIGALGIEAREYVYNLAGSDDVLSLLIWQSLAPTATA